MEKEQEDKRRRNYDYIALLTKSEEDRHELAIQLSIAQSKKVSAEAKLKEVKQELKSHDQRYTQLHKISESYRKRLTDLELKVTVLADELEVSREEVVRISPQLAVACSIQNRAWGLGYKLGIKQFREYLLAHLVSDLRGLDWKSLKASRAAYQVFDSLGRNGMPNAFPPPDAEARP